MNLFARLQKSIADSDRIAIQTIDGSAWTYGDLVAFSGQLANVLNQRRVQPGDRVAVQVDKSVPAFVLYWACVRAGAVFLPLNTAYTLSELDYFLNDARPALMVCDPARVEDLRPLADAIGTRLESLDAAGGGSLTEAAKSAATEFATVDCQGDDLAAILYTSGTTGRSKGAMLSHDNLYSNAQTLIQSWQFSDRDVLIHALPIYHTHGLFVAGNVCLFAGARMLFLPKFDAERITGLMPEATCLMGVPTFYTRLLQQPNLGEAAKTMRLFISGSAPLLAETHRQWQERTGHLILERYGMTETNMNISNPYEGERIPGSVGLPLEGVEIRITDLDSGEQVPQGEIGMIEVRGPNVFKGYWQMPEKTAEELRANGFFITGDLGRMDDGGYVYIIGRNKDLIISGGLNIYPKEVEDAIDAIDGVAESAVIGVPHEDFGEAVVAVVVRSGEVSATDISQQLQSRLARFKQPREVLFVDQLPRNSMGKVQKNLLREQFAVSCG